MKCEICNKRIRKSYAIAFKVFKPNTCKKCEKIFREEVLEKGFDNFDRRVEKECKK